MDILILIVLYCGAWIGVFFATQVIFFWIFGKIDKSDPWHQSKMPYLTYKKKG